MASLTQPIQSISSSDLTTFLNGLKRQEVEFTQNSYKGITWIAEILSGANKDSFHQALNQAEDAIHHKDLERANNSIKAASRYWQEYLTSRSFGKKSGVMGPGAIGGSLFIGGAIAGGASAALYIGLTLLIRLKNTDSSNISSISLPVLQGLQQSTIDPHQQYLEKLKQELITEAKAGLEAWEKDPHAFFDYNSFLLRAGWLARGAPYEEEYFNLLKEKWDNSLKAYAAEMSHCSDFESQKNRFIANLRRDYLFPYTKAYGNQTDVIERPGSNCDSATDTIHSGGQKVLQLPSNVDLLVQVFPSHTQAVLVNTNTHTYEDLLSGEKYSLQSLKNPIYHRPIFLLSFLKGQNQISGYEEWKWLEKLVYADISHGSWERFKQTVLGQSEKSDFQTNSILSASGGIGPRYKEGNTLERDYSIPFEVNPSTGSTLEVKQKSEDEVDQKMIPLRVILLSEIADPKEKKEIEHEFEISHGRFVFYNPQTQLDVSSEAELIFKDEMDLNFYLHTLHTKEQRKQFLLTLTAETLFEVYNSPTARTVVSLFKNTERLVSTHLSSQQTSDLTEWIGSKEVKWQGGIRQAQAFRAMNQMRHLNKWLEINLSEDPLTAKNDPFFQLGVGPSTHKDAFPEVALANYFRHKIPLIEYFLKREEEFINTNRFNYKDILKALSQFSPEQRKFFIKSLLQYYYSVSYDNSSANSKNYDYLKSHGIIGFASDPKKVQIKLPQKSFIEFTLVNNRQTTVSPTISKGEPKKNNLEKAESKESKNSENNLEESIPVPFELYLDLLNQLADFRLTSDIQGLSDSWNKDFSMQFLRLNKTGEYDKFFLTYHVLIVKKGADEKLVKSPIQSQKEYVVLMKSIDPNININFQAPSLVPEHVAQVLEVIKTRRTTAF